MRKLQHYFFRHNILFRVNKILICTYLIKVVPIRMYKQPIFCTSHPHIVPTHQLIIFHIMVSNEHIYVIKLSPLGFMNGRYHNVCSRSIAEIFHRRLKYKFFEVANVFCFIGLFKQLYTTLHIRQTLASVVSGKGNMFCIFP